MSLQSLIKEVEGLVEVRKGGKGSGNFGHGGRPGAVGGSGGRNAGMGGLNLKLPF